MRVLITGAAGGLGSGLVARLGADGHQLGLLDRAAIDASLPPTRPDPPAGVVFALAGDVSDETVADHAVAQMVAQVGGLDALINCAGIGGPSTAVVDTKVEEFRRVLEVNLVGCFLMARAAARRLVAQGTGGAVINVGSVFGEQAVAGGAGYCAAKGGLRQLTQSMALELAVHRIRVNTVSPGHMATEMHREELRARARRHQSSVDAEAAAVLRSIPLARFGSGEDVAGCVTWLLSDDAAYVTGQSIAVNGGAWLS
ncbi:MAG TPA: SDR family oxidoreductase [Verrucomicrobiae bacterium]|nr:SDR family oxidoreductase [Verrucomicrobiae bacterium]